EKTAPRRIKTIKPLHRVSIGGVDFEAVRFETQLGAAGIHQESYVTLRRGYALVLGVVAARPEALEEARPVLASLRF
ncbi:MAG: hypothetical protein AAB289_14175, partial [Chloroflexota bacterium]